MGKIEKVMDYEWVYEWMRPYYCADNGQLREVSAGNMSNSTAWDVVYDQITDRFSEAKFIVMDAEYKTPWIAKKTLEDSRIPISHTMRGGSWNVCTVAGAA